MDASHRVCGMSRRTFELLALAGKTWFALVAGVLLGFAGIVQAVRGADESAYVLALLAALALVVAFGWVAYLALRHRDDARKAQPSVHHNYNAPVTIVQGQFGPSEPILRFEPVGPSVPSEEMPVVKLHDFVEFPSGGPPAIRDREFRHVALKGPIWLHGRNSSIIGSSFITGDDGPWTMLWPLEPGEGKVGVVLLENCVIRECTTEHVGFVGTREALEELIRKTTSRNP